MWYYATILYFRKYYHKDPRERDGLAANTFAVSTALTVLSYALFASLFVSTRI
jgi:hypothetical protein